MKYQVRYRLTHPEYLPSVASHLIDAGNHDELESGLSKLVMKWQDQGYTIQMLRVDEKKPRRKPLLPQDPTLHAP